MNGIKLKTKEATDWIKQKDYFIHWEHAPYDTGLSKVEMLLNKLSNEVHADACDNPIKPYKTVCVVLIVLGFNLSSKPELREPFNLLNDVKSVLEKQIVRRAVMASTFEDSNY